MITRFLPIWEIVILVSTIHAEKHPIIQHEHEQLSNTSEPIQVCDIPEEEGSGAEDCPINTRCCSQLICDQLSNKTVGNNPVQRCCNEDERKLPSSSTNCTRCTKCCTTHEMERIPFPAECSKCASCSHGKIRPDTSY